MKDSTLVIEHGRGVWRCRGAECREVLARMAGFDDRGGSRVEIRVEMVRLPSPDGTPTYGRSRSGAKDHRHDWSSEDVEYRDLVVLPVRLHCPRCRRTQRLRDVLS